MKVALLLTGLYRSFDLTSKFIEQNLIEPNNAYTFIICQTELYEKQLEKAFKNCTVKCYKNRPKEINEIYNTLIKTKSALQPNKFSQVGLKQSYLLNSGTLIEYYDVMNCFKMMYEYEEANNIKFDIIIRSRLDILIAQPLNIKAFFTKVPKNLKEVTADYIMNLGNKTMIENNRGITDRYGYVCKMKTKSFNSAEEALEHINNKNYVWTLNPNQVWIGKRHVMKKFDKILDCYGDFDIGTIETFNSETQFSQFCKHNHIQHFWYNSKVDSMYGPYWSDQQYNRSLYIKPPPKNLIQTIIR